MVKKDNVYKIIPEHAFAEHEARGFKRVEHKEAAENRPKGKGKE
jgi:hypothetical protein